MPRTSTKKKATSMLKRRSEVSKASSPTTFKRFLRLPPEIRQQIWRLALPLASSLGVCLLPHRFPPSGQVKRVVENPYTPLRVVCRESRAIAFPKARPYDPDTDILYISGPEFKSFCHVCRDKRWPAQIRHIAISLSLADADHWFHVPDDPSESLLPLRYLTNLEKVSIVYPQSKANVDYHEKVAIPRQRVQTLRELTNKEVTSLKIHAEYWPERDYQETWTRSAQQHLSYFKGVLTDQARAERPPCWDETKKRLMLTFEGRYFVHDASSQYQ